MLEEDQYNTNIKILHFDNKKRAFFSLPESEASFFSQQIQSQFQELIQNLNKNSIK